MIQLLANHRVLDCLSARGEGCSIQRLCNGQVELRWAGVTLFLRMADLLVLDEALRAWTGNVERPWSDAYVLSLRYAASPPCSLYLDRDALYTFCALVNEAVERLPRRVVRWADLVVDVQPWRGERAAPPGSFSTN